MTSPTHTIPLPMCTCYDITVPITIRAHVEHANHFPGAYEQLTVHCTVCDNKWTWDTGWDPTDIEYFAVEHHNNHKATGQ